jgi:hypothetical protein
MTTLHDFGGVLGRYLDTFFWALTASWSRLLACGPEQVCLVSHGWPHSSPLIQHSKPPFQATIPSLKKRKEKKEKKQKEEEEEEEVSAATHAIDVGQLFEARGNCKAKEYSLNNCSKQSTQHKNLNSLCY